MALKIGVSRGHGKYTAGKRSPAGEREWYFNDTAADAFVDEISKYEGVEIITVSDPTGEVDTPLTTRTNLANKHGADVYIAFHHNAFRGVWFSGGGSEVHVRPNAPQSHKLATIVADKVSKAMGLPNRGVKVTNLHETREPHQLAILIEGGFMDSTRDIKALRDKNKLRAQGRGVASGVVQYFGLKQKAGQKAPAAPKVPGDVYTVKKGNTLYAIAKAAGTTVANLKSYNKLKSNVIKIGQKLKLKKPASKPKPAKKFNKYDKRGRSTKAHFSGTIDHLGAEVRKRRGSRVTGFNWNKKAGYNLKPGAKVYVFEVHDGWARIYTGRRTGKGSNDWVHLDRVKV